MNLFKTQISRKTEYFFLFLSLIFLAFNCNYTFNIYDEGVAVTGAMRVLHGEIPYRDFWTMYAPGQYYFLAGLFKIFGQSLLVERIFSVVILWGIAVTSWKISKTFLSKNSALAILLLETLWISSYRFYGSPLATGLLLAILSVYYAILFLKTQNIKYIFFAGIFAGFAAIFRHDLGAYTIIALSAVMIAHHFHHFKSDFFKEIFKNFSIFLLGILTVVIPAALYFLSQIPLKTLTDQLITFPATTFADYRALPFPTILQLFKSHSLKEIVKNSIELCMFYLPILALFITLSMFLKRIFRKNPELPSPHFLEISVLWAVSVIFMMQVSVRADGSHLLAPMVPAIIVSVFVVNNRIFLPRFKNIFTVIIFLFGLGAFSGGIFSKVMVLKKQFTEEKFVLKIEKAAGISGDDFFKEYDKLLQFLKENTAENEKIFVGNTHHDKLSGNDAMLYFLSNRLPATKYHELHPGAATSENVQNEIIDELLKNNVKTVVLREEILTLIEPNKSSLSSSIFVLDNFLKSNFREVAKFGDYTVLKRVEN